MSRSFLTRLFAASLLCASVGASVSRAQNIWYVDDDAAPGGSGVSWDEPFSTLQDALAAAASFDEIRVAGGLYVPSVPTDPNDPRSATFLLVNDVRIVGGHAGLADPNDPDMRDTFTYASTLSGDLHGDDGSGFAGNDENCYHVVTSLGDSDRTVLEGFIVRGGNANGEPPHHAGGAAYIEEGAPLIADSIFRDNRAEWGGAIYCGEGASSAVLVCSFENNAAGRGGAVFNHLAEPAFGGCLFTGNRAELGGGAVYNYTDSHAGFRGCWFGGNSAAWGGGIGNESSDPRIVWCRFDGNSALLYFGGGLYNYDSEPVVANCRFRGNSARCGGAISQRMGGLTMLNCELTGNQALEEGGGLDNCGGLVRLTNCTLSDNAAGDIGGGVCDMGDSYIEVTNCVVWGNAATIDPELPQTVVATYSCIRDWLSGGPGTITEDPLFLDPDGPDDDPATWEDNDYHLADASPSVDTGSNWAVPFDLADLDGDGDHAEFTPLDLDEEGRFFDNVDAPDYGQGYSPLVDMGAYEWGGTGPQPCIGDFDGDRDIDLGDLAHLLAHFGTTSGGWYMDGDLDRDGDVDLGDLAILLADYRVPCD